MKVTLEKAELISILSNTFGYPITDSDVDVTADPFEIRINNLPPPKLEAFYRTQALETPVPDAPAETVEEAEEELLTIEDVLAHNEKMKTQNPLDRTAQALKRPLGASEYEDPPPVTEKELRMTAKEFQELQQTNSIGLLALRRLSGG